MDQIKIKSQLNRPYIMRNKDFFNKIKKKKEKTFIPEEFNYFLDMETFVMNDKGE